MCSFLTTSTRLRCERFPLRVRLRARYLNPLSFPLQVLESALGEAVRLRLGLL